MKKKAFILFTYRYSYFTDAKHYVEAISEFGLFILFAPEKSNRKPSLFGKGLIEGQL